MDTSFSSISALLSQFSTIASGSTGGSVILSYVAASGEAKTASFKAVSPVSSQNSSSSSTVFKLLDVKGIKSLLLYFFFFFGGGGVGGRGRSELVANSQRPIKVFRMSSFRKYSEETTVEIPSFPC